MSLHGHAMHVHTYLDAVKHGETLDRLSRAYLTLGMTELQTGLSVRLDGPSPTRLLSLPDAPDAPRRIYQALDYATARLTASLVCLAPNDCTTWTQLEAQWQTAAGSVSDTDCVGRVHLVYALYDGEKGDPGTLAAAAMADLPRGYGALRAEPAEPLTHCYLWEASAHDENRVNRVLVLVAPAARENESDALVWPSGKADLPPLPGYLWEMAKVRHEARRFVERRALSLRGALFDRASRFELAEASHPEPTAEREETLERLQRDAALAAAGEAALRIMYRTVEAAATNANRWLPTRPADAPGPIGDDHRYIAWLQDEIKDEADTLKDTVAYAEPMARLGSAEIEQRLRELGERSEFITVAQTAVIAGIGLALAASQTLGYTWPTYAALKTPFIVMVALVGLYLPLLALRSHARRVWRRFWICLIGACLAGSVGWFATTGLELWRTKLPARWELSLGVFGVIAVIVFALAWGTTRTAKTKPAK